MKSPHLKAGHFYEGNRAGKFRQIVSVITDPETGDVWLLIERWHGDFCCEITTVEKFANWAKRRLSKKEAEKLISKIRAE